MKNTIKKVLVLLFVFVLATACFASCKKPDNNQGNNNTNNGGETVYSLELRSDKTQAVCGEQVTLSAFLKSQGSETPYNEAVYTIVEGADYATISGNVLTIGSNAADGTVIKVKTSKDGVDSNVVAITVIPSTYVESIFISTNSESTSIMKGTTVGLVANISPAGIAQSFIQWEITEGADYATITGDALTIKSDAPAGSIVKVRATFGEVVSNEISLTVAATQEEINAGKYHISITNNNLVVDKNGYNAPIIYVQVFDYNFDVVSDAKVEYQVIEGESLLALSPAGYICSLEAKGHGTAKVQVSISGTTISEEVTVDVIVPPTAVTLPEVFSERPIEYNFSMRDSLPFAPGIIGENACTDIAYTFTHESGATGDEVAVYENGAITFKKTGRVIVNAQSNSGSRVEASVSYTFNINDGYNVYNFAELNALVESGAYNGQEINLVVLDKVVGAGDYQYGYSLVPPAALLPADQQTVAAIVEGVVVDGVVNRLNGETLNGVRVDASVKAYNKSIWINGNEHTIDASQLRVFNMTELEEYCGEDKNTANYTIIDSLISVVPTTTDSNSKSFSVKAYDLEFKGNCGIDYDPKNYRDDGYVGTIGVVDKGLNIGSKYYTAHYYIDADNLTGSGFYGAFNFHGIVGNGKVSNVYAYNCYSTGIFCRSSIITFENLKFGPCGATGIELAAENCAEAGLNNDENQTVTILGTIDAATNLNAGNTNYFNNYVVGGATIPYIINGNVVMYPENMTNHIRNENGEFIFVSLVFMDVYSFEANTSVINYPSYQQGGIIEITSLPVDGVDTVHQFVRMPIYIDLPGVGTVQAGTALFLNLNYGK